MSAFPARTDINLSALHTYFVTADTIPSSIRTLAISEIEREIMPRARDDKTLHPPFTQGPAFMRTEVVYGKDFSVHVEQGDGAVV